MAHQAANGTRYKRGRGTVTPLFLEIRHRWTGVRRELLACAAAAAAAAIALAGCGLDSSIGSWTVDPGRYDAYRCNDLTARWKQLNERQKELANLMDKASQGSGGAVVGTMAYRSDYESVLGEKKLVQRQAAEKKCELVAIFQSDTGIH